MAVLFLGLWSVALVRAVRFIEQAKRYAQEAVTNDAVDDLHYAYSLFYSYLVSLLVSLALIVFLSRRPRLAALGPVAVLLWAVLRVLVAKPETPIHLFPAMLPVTPVVICLGAVGLTYFTSRRGARRLP